MEKDSYLCIGHSVPRVDALDKVLSIIRAKDLLHL